VPKAFAREFQLITFARPIESSLLDGLAAESVKIPAHVWHAAFAGFMGHDFSSRLGEIKVPTLAVRGRHDTICPAAKPQRFAHDLRNFVTAVAAEEANF
jgi:pimeloyl-ACP methyl ester carboxylesterase